MSKVKENYFIDCLKFIFSFCIVFYHSWVFAGGFGNGFFNYGYLAVDFYFVVTGYLMINSINKRKNKDSSQLKSTFDFVYKKFKKLIPALLVTFGIGIVLVYGKTAIFDLKLILSNNLLPELFQLSIFGYGLTINSSWWYISAMLFVIALLYPFAVKDTDNYCKSIAPLIIAFTLALVKFLEININDPVCITFLFRNGLYEALIFIPLGNIAYALASKIKKKKYTKNEKKLLSMFEILLYIILIINLHYFFIDTVLYAVLLTINVSLTFSNVTYAKEIFKKDIWKKLGNYGFYMFLCNVSIRKYIKNRYLIYNLSYKKMFLLFVLMTVVIALFIYILVEIIYKEHILKKCCNKKQEAE